MHGGEAGETVLHHVLLAQLPERSRGWLWDELGLVALVAQVAGG